MLREMIISQIAACEVINRLAITVKELIEKILMPGLRILW
jgi:DNA mismatch repair ATPase MutL